MFSEGKGDCHSPSTGSYSLHEMTAGVGDPSEEGPTKKTMSGTLEKRDLSTLTVQISATGVGTIGRLYNKLQLGLPIDCANFHYLKFLVCIYAFLHYV